MAKAKNMVIAGDLVGKAVIGGVKPGIITGFLKQIDINKETIESYELITESIAKSAVSGVTRGVVGGLLLGPVGLLAGTLTAKKNGILNVALQFKDGKKSLIEIDEKIYKDIIKNCF